MKAVLRLPCVCLYLDVHIYIYVPGAVSGRGGGAYRAPMVARMWRIWLKPGSYVKGLIKGAPTSDSPRSAKNDQNIIQLYINSTRFLCGWGFIDGGFAARHRTQVHGVVGKRGRETRDQRPAPRAHHTYINTYIYIYVATVFRHCVLVCLELRR